MPLGIMGIKVGMTQIYDEAGKVAPVTVIKAGPCPILLIRDQKRDGYDAVQLGFVDKPRRNASKPERGHVAANLESRRRAARAAAGIVLPPKADCEPQRYIREFRLEAPATQTVGSVLTVNEVFKEIKAVDVIGRTKGRGMTGTMKRHNYGGMRGSHGVKKGNRQRGSMSSNASNRGSGRPKKGIRMAGHYGDERVTVRNLDVVKIDADNHLLMVRGAVPGANGGLLLIRPTNKKK